MRHSLRQGMEMQVKIANSDNGDDQNNANHDHQDVGFTRRGDKAWQMMGGGWMKLVHATLHFVTGYSLLGL